MRDALIAPTFRVEGNFSNAGDVTQGELRIVDVATGTVLRRRAVSVRFEDFDLIYRRIVRVFTRDICDFASGTTTTLATTSTTIPGGSRLGLPCADSTGCGRLECCGLGNGSPSSRICCSATSPILNATLPCGGVIAGTSLGCRAPAPVDPSICGPVPPGPAPPRRPVRSPGSASPAPTARRWSSPSTTRRPAPRRRGRRRTRSAAP